MEGRTRSHSRITRREGHRLKNQPFPTGCAPHSARQRKPPRKLPHLGADGGDGRFVGAVGERLVDEIGDVHHLLLEHAAGGDGGGADADAAALEDGARCRRGWCFC